MKKLVGTCFLVLVILGSAFATPISRQTQIDTIKKIRSIKPMRLHRDTMVKKPMKKDTTKKV